MSVPSNTALALSQIPNRNLEVLPLVAKGANGFQQQIENEMQALSDQGLHCLGRIKEMLILGENMSGLALEYTWATWQFVIREETWREEYDSIEAFKESVDYNGTLNKMLKAQDMKNKRQVRMLVPIIVLHGSSADLRFGSYNRPEPFFDNGAACLISCYQAA